MQINIKTRQENLWFYFVDGMGGHRAGNIASEMAVTDLGAAWVSSEIETVNQVMGMVCRTFRSCEPSDPFSWAR